MEEDAPGVFPDHIPELRLLATCTLHVVVGHAGSSFNSLDGGEFIAQHAWWQLHSALAAYTLSGMILGFLLPFLCALWYHGYLKSHDDSVLRLVRCSYYLA
jgi:hypothetical protein